MPKNIGLLMLLCVFIASCNIRNETACTMDAKICPDGSAVGRTGPDCEFEECPATEDDTGTSGCDYSKTEPKYVGKGEDECSRIRFTCTSEREYFADECGCGCRLKSSDKLKATDCPAQRPEICTEEYDPVCGWFNPEKIQCIKYPCAQTYSNSCTACTNKEVISWTEGECPE